MDEFWAGLFTGFVVAIVVLAFVAFIVGEVQYKQGQIDTLNGEIHYQLEKQDNGTTIWVYCEEVCKGN